MAPVGTVSGNIQTLPLLTIVKAGNQSSLMAPPGTEAAPQHNFQIPQSFSQPALRQSTPIRQAFQAISTGQQSIDIITASDASSNSQSSQSTISKAVTTGQEVSGLFNLALKLANAGAQGKQIVNTIGSAAQKFVQGTLSKEAAANLLTEAGVGANLIPHITTDDLINSGYQYIANGFDKASFLSSLETSATKNMAEAAAKAGKTAVDSTSAVGIGGQVLGAVGAAYSAYQVFSNWGKGGTLQAGLSSAVSGATAGAYLGSTIFPGVGTVIGGALGGIVGLVGGLISDSGKSKAQIARDEVRNTLQQAGIIDTNWNLTLADGTLYDIGKDGGFKLQNVEGTTRGAYDVDFKNPLAGSVAGMANSLAAVATGGDPVLTSQYAGYFTNAALSNATTLDDAKRNLQAIFSKFSAKPEQIMQAIAGLIQQGRVTSETGQAYINGFVSIFHTSDNA